MPFNFYIMAVAVVGAAILAWYCYQIASRKKKWLRYKLKRTTVGLTIYLVAAITLKSQGLSPVVAVVSAIFVGLGAQWLLVPAPNRNRRISKSVRAAVIARDLESKGLKWDPAKYHIDHWIPYSQGGDNSLRNLHVVPREANLRKGGKMPSVHEVLTMKELKRSKQA